MKHWRVGVDTETYTRRIERKQTIGVPLAPSLGKNLALAATAVFTLVALTLVLLSASPAWSATPAIIDNDVIQLGVNPEGHLNAPGGAPSSGTGTTMVGLRYVPTGAEGTAAGSPYEGWGVADANSGITGYANRALDGVENMTPVSFDTTDSSAVSVVDIGSTFRVTHDYHPSPDTPNLYEVVVTIENKSENTVDARYRRVMDWDIEPTAFYEHVTINGGTSSDLRFSSNDGFASANPLAAPSNRGQTGSFEDAGPSDHGALFDFGFGNLAPGESKKFRIFYGAADTEATAESALSLVEAEVFSLGQPNTPDGPALGKPNTFIFGFSGVGGKVVIPPDTTPPAEASDFDAAPGNKKATLTWTNPTDGDFSAVRVFRSTEGEVTDPKSAGHVYEGNDETFDDTGLTNGIEYTYTIFTRDAAGNFSEGVTTTATPERDNVGISLGSLTHTYDGTSKSATAATTPENLEVDFTYTDEDGNPATAPTNAGTYDVTATVDDDDRTGTATGELVIGKAPLTVTADDANKVYGEENPSFTASYDGFVNDENESDLVGSLTFATDADSMSNAGEYPVTPGGLSSRNYEISFVAGKLTVSKASATVSLGSLSQTFDGAAKAATVTTTPGGLAVVIAYSQNGEPVESPTNIGDYDVTATVDDANYVGEATGVMRILDPAPNTTITFGPEGPTLANTMTFRYFGEDGQSPQNSLLYSYRLNQGAWSKYTPAKAATGLQRLPDGAYTFQVRAKDPDGNVDPTPAERSFVVDTVKPTGSISILANTYNRTTKNVDVNLAASDPGGTGVGEMRLKVNNDSWTSWQPFAPSAKVSLAGKSGGVAIVVQYRDRAGNPSTAYHATMIVPR